MSIPASPERRKKTREDRRRLATRNDVWPESPSWVWDLSKAEVKGFATMPRLMPWILVLIKELAGKGVNPTGPYLDLWCRDFGQSFVEIKDVEDHAYASGYRGQRGVRTWREHMQKLVDLGFIKVEGKGNRSIAYALLMDPLAVARWYQEQNRTPTGWWRAFSDRAAEIGAVIPPALAPPVV